MNEKIPISDNIKVILILGVSSVDCVCYDGPEDIHSFNNVKYIYDISQVSTFGRCTLDTLILMTKRFKRHGCEELKRWAGQVVNAVANNLRFLSYNGIIYPYKGIYVNPSSFNGSVYFEIIVNLYYGMTPIINLGEGLFSFDQKHQFIWITGAKIIDVT